MLVMNPIACSRPSTSKRCRRRRRTARQKPKIRELGFQRQHGLVRRKKLSIVDCRSFAEGHQLDEAYFAAQFRGSNRTSGDSESPL